MTARDNISHWLQAAPEWKHSSAPLPSYARIAILGAGVMGCSLAYWLARAGSAPLVLERNAAPAHGASGRNGGLMVQGSTRPYWADVERLGPEAARAIYQLTVENQDLVQEVLARETIEAGFALTAKLDLATEGEISVLRKTADALRAEGHAADWLDPTATAEYLGTGVGPGIAGGLYRPGQGRVDAARYTYGMAEAAIRSGAQFAFSTQVQLVQRAPYGRGWQVRTSRTVTPVEQVVVAVNAWGGDLFPELARLITPTRGHVVVTEPVDFHLIPWNADRGYVYGAQLESGQLLIGGLRNLRPDQEAGHAPLPGENVAPVLPEMRAALQAALPRYLPEAEGVAVVHCWTGNMAFTPDELPLVGRWPGRDGLWIMAGFSGHGMSYSQAVPRALAAQMTGTEGAAIPAPFNPARYLAT